MTLYMYTNLINLSVNRVLLLYLKSYAISYACAIIKLTITPCWYSFWFISSTEQENFRDN